jgi:hypothetical protein
LNFTTEECLSQGSEVQRLEFRVHRKCEQLFREFQDVDHAGRTRGAIRSFIKYLPTYKQGQRKKSNPERFTLLNRVPFGKFNKVNPEPVNGFTGRHLPVESNSLFRVSRRKLELTTAGSIN